MHNNGHRRHVVPVEDDRQAARQAGPEGAKAADRGARKGEEGHRGKERRGRANLRRELDTQEERVLELLALVVACRRGRVQGEERRGDAERGQEHRPGDALARERHGQLRSREDLQGHGQLREAANRSGRQVGRARGHHVVGDHAQHAAG